MSEQDILADARQAIALGDAVQSFLMSQTGLFLTERIEMETADAIDELKSADAEDPKAIRKAQNRIRMLEDLKVWLAEAVQTANEIERQMLAPSDS